MQGRKHWLFNAHGALMVLADEVAPKQRLLMQNIDSGEHQEGTETLPGIPQTGRD
jgi:hypothetical protein